MSEKSIKAPAKILVGLRFKKLRGDILKVKLMKAKQIKLKQLRRKKLI